MFLRALRLATTTRRLLAACVALALLLGALDLGHLVQPRHEHDAAAAVTVMVMASDHGDASTDRDVAAVRDHHCHGCVQLAEPAGTRIVEPVAHAGLRSAAPVKVLHGLVPPAPARPPRSAVLT